MAMEKLIANPCLPGKLITFIKNVSQLGMNKMFALPAHSVSENNAPSYLVQTISTTPKIVRPPPTSIKCSKENITLFDKYAHATKINYPQACKQNSIPIFYIQKINCFFRKTALPPSPNL